MSFDWLLSRICIPNAIKIYPSRSFALVCLERNAINHPTTRLTTLRKINFASEKEGIRFSFN